MEFPDDLLYTKEHEWLRVIGDTAVIGITDYAQSQLGDIVYTELPDIGMEFAPGNAFSVVESVKTVSDIYSPITGTIAEVNDNLESSPEQINAEPYKGGWIVKMTISDAGELEKLLSPEEYESLVNEESH